jgi:hypothetical protein
VLLSFFFQLALGREETIGGIMGPLVLGGALQSILGGELEIVLEMFLHFLPLFIFRVFQFISHAFGLLLCLIVLMDGLDLSLQTLHLALVLDVELQQFVGTLRVVQ